MNVIAKGLLSAALVAAFGVSQASPIYYTVNGGATKQLDIDPITDTFSGTTTLVAGACSLECTLNATGTLSDNGSTVDLAVTAASVTGGFLCSTVGLSGFPWTASVPHTNPPITSPTLDPILFELSGVSVTSFCGSCSDMIEVTFDADNGGQFIFDGPIYNSGGNSSCNVDGTLSSSAGNYYVAWH